MKDDISWAQGQRGRHYQPDRVRDVASCESVGLCSVECVVCGVSSVPDLSRLWIGDTAVYTMNREYKSDYDT